MTKTSFFAVLCLAAFATGAAFAREPIFVAPDQTNAFEILPTPPSNESSVTAAELAELHRLETTRTEAESAQAKWDDENENIFLFKFVFGDKFTAEALPITNAFGRRVRNDEGVNTNGAKAGFHRERPFNLDKSLHPICKTKPQDDSYPSGHATSGYLLALTLIDMVPEKRDEILARADAYARNRLICGVHYPSDIEASKLLGYSIHAIMEQNPQYKTELAAAKAELRTALGLPTTN